MKGKMKILKETETETDCNKQEKASQIWMKGTNNWDERDTEDVDRYDSG